MIAAARRLAASPRGRVAVAATAVPAVALLSLSPGALSSAAARAGLVAGALAAVAALVRRRGAAQEHPAIAIVARRPIAGDAGLAVVDAAGRRLLVGYARGGVSLVAELGAPPEEKP